jgi:YidC/Oxa1 family membrane protein insertase
MELYKSEGVNPLGGCMPMLLQIPVFLALFFALTSKEFAVVLTAAGSKAHFLWITALGKPDYLHYVFPWLSPWLLGKEIDKFSIMAILIGLSTYWSSLTMPGAAKTQKSMLYFMPPFIAFISVSFPAGVQLYWVVQNLLTVAQQLYILRK